MKLTEIRKYQKKDGHSYCMGSFPAFELLHTRPEIIEMILVHSDTNAEILKKLTEECKKADVRILQSDRPIEKIRDKENCMAAAVFHKYQSGLEHDKNHVVLVNPGDAGNLGTIIRSCVGFGITNLAVIEPAVDIFEPKVVRASMGAIFRLNVQCFESYARYEEEYGSERENYPFMLDGAYRIGEIAPLQGRAYSLIFGNESRGLDRSYLETGKSIVIPHSPFIDSLNLATAVGIGIYEFHRHGSSE